MAPPARLLRLARIPLTLVGVSLCLVFYHRFLLDVNLRNLKTSLSLLDIATGVGQAEAALVLLDQLLVTEMVREESDLQALATLQYTQGVLNSPKRERPVDDALAMIGVLTREREETRTDALKTIDGFLTGVQRRFNQLLLVPRRFGAGRISPEIDQMRLAEALQSERMGDLSRAIETYEGLIRTYPLYRGVTTLKLHLGYLYQRARRHDRARELYRQVLRGSQSPEEVEMARNLLAELNRLPGKRRAAQRMNQRLRAIEEGLPRQRFAYQLGSLWIELFELPEAADAFDVSFRSLPQGKLALPSLFKKCWCLKSMGRWEEALRCFRELIERDPQGPWATAALLQMAEGHKVAGQLEEAMAIYDRVTSESREKALVALSLSLAGSTALFELNDPDRAWTYFKLLGSKYPISPFAALQKKLAQLEAERPTTATGAAQFIQLDMPLLGFMEQALAKFIEVFAERLAKYMEAVGEKELSRKYSEDEFRQLVLRRVQEFFPGQIRDVHVVIRPEGYTGSGVVHLGPLSFPVEGQVDIEVVNERPHVVLNEIRILKATLPKTVLSPLEERVNATIDGMELPLRVLEYDLKEGHAFIRVKLSENE